MASNWFFLALKTFGYSFLGYLILALVIVLVVFVVGLVVNASAGT